MRLSILAVFSVVLLISATPIAAGPITIQNPSFESPSCSAASCVPANWTVTGGFGGEFAPGVGPWDSIPDGVQVGWSNGGTLTQILGATVAPNTDYTLSLWVSQRWSAGSFEPEINLLAGNSSVLTMNLVTPGGGVPTKNVDGTYQWVQWTLSWVSPGSGPTIGQSLGISLGSDGIQTDFDAVSLSASQAPELAAMLLVGLGLLGVFALRRLC